MARECRRGIYRVRFVPTGEVKYIGSSIDMHKRWGAHRNELNRGNYKTMNPRWQNAWNKYGEVAFCFEVEEDHTGMPPDFWTDAYLCEREAHFIAAYPGLFNNVPARRPPSQVGKTLSPERKALLRASLIGRMVSEETRRRISESQKGRVIPREQIERMASAKRGRCRSPEHVEKTAAALRGRKRPIDVVEAIAKANSGTYSVTDPNGVTQVIKNLNQFCRDHRLCSSEMSLVSRGKCVHHKGWKCTVISPSPSGTARARK